LIITVVYTNLLRDQNIHKKHLKNVGPIRYCEPPLNCQSPGVASRTPAITIAQAACDVHNDDNDNAWQRGSLWPHGMGPIKICTQVASHTASVQCSSTGVRKSKRSALFDNKFPRMLSVKLHCSLLKLIRVSIAIMCLLLLLYVYDMPWIFTHCFSLFIFFSSFLLHFNVYDACFFFPFLLQQFGK